MTSTPEKPALSGTDVADNLPRARPSPEPAAAISAKPPKSSPAKKPPPEKPPPEKPKEPFRIATEPEALPAAAGAKAITILQLGDSHTAADFFTGPLRVRLQARYGAGGIGYLPAGRPHPGVLSDLAGLSASDGWTYQGIRTAQDVSPFFLSGFVATASAPGQTLTWTLKDGAVPFSRVEVEAVFGPDRGGIEVAIDDAPPIRQSLARNRTERLVLRIEPTSIGPKTVHKVVIRTLDGGQVSLGGIGLLRPERGLTYVNFGYPGATADALAKLSGGALQDDLRRINPQVVVLAFGTNEGFDDGLDVEGWAGRYRETIHHIRSTLPRARLVLIGPPDGNRLPKDCQSPPGASPKPPVNACLPPGAEVASGSCQWQTPPHLGPVRKAIQKLAAETGSSYWNWASISPRACGAHALVHAMPALMAGDHVHFTRDGYRRSADLFFKTLVSVIDKAKAPNRAVSNH